MESFAACRKICTATGNSLECAPREPADARGPPPSVATDRTQFAAKPILRHVELDCQSLSSCPQGPRSRILLPRHRHSREGTLAGSRRPRGRPPFRSGGWAAGSCRRCFTDRIGRIAHGNRPSAREPGRFRPDVSQFVDAEPTGPDRRLERRRNPPLRRELLNTATHICLREPGRKPEPSVIATMGMVIVLAALLLRTSPGIHLRFDTERNARLVTCAGGSPGNPTPEVISRCRRPFWGEFAHT